MRTILGIAALGVMIVASASSLRGDQLSPADAASRISGTWAFNPDLSPAFSEPGRTGRGRAGRGGSPLLQAGSAQPNQPRFPQGVRANPTNTEPTASGASDLTPAELAERGAMRRIGQIEPMITIAATADHVSFSDDRGELECDVNGKAAKVRLFGAWVDVRCRWDKGLLRQEYATTRSKLVRTWSVDGNGMLVLKSKLEGIDRNTPEAAALFDRVR